MGQTECEAAAAPFKAASKTTSTDSYRLIKLRQNDSSNKLGFSLRGGREATGSSVGVFVSHTEPNGQAHQVGLRAGDQLIQVNGLQASQATYDEVIELIRRTPKRDHICLLVNYVGRIPFQEKAGLPIRWLQIEPPDLETGAEPEPEPRQALCDDLTHERALGRARNDEVARVGSGGHVSQGPRITAQQQVGRAATEAARGGHTRAASYQDDSAASSQSLTFSSASSTKEEEDDDDDDDDEPDVERGCLELEPEARIASSAASSASFASSSSTSGCSTSMSSVQSSNSSAGGPPRPLVARTTANDAKQSPLEEGETLVLVPGGARTSEPFGCGVVKGPELWPGIFVQNVRRDSLAHRVGLEPGDELVRAGAHCLAELGFERAIELIKSLQQSEDELLLVVRKGAALKHLAECKEHDRMLRKHLLKGEEEEEEKAANGDGLGQFSGPALSEAAQLQQAAGGQQRIAVREKPLERPPAPPVRSGARIEEAAERREQQQRQLQARTTAQKSQPGDFGRFCSRNANSTAQKAPPLVANSISAQQLGCAINSTATAACQCSPRAANRRPPQRSSPADIDDEDVRPPPLSSDRAAARGRLDGAASETVAEAAPVLLARPSTKPPMIAQADLQICPDRTCAESAERGRRLGAATASEPQVLLPIVKRSPLAHCRQSCPGGGKAAGQILSYRSDGQSIGAGAECYRRRKHMGEDGAGGGDVDDDDDDYRARANSSNGRESQLVHHASMSPTTTSEQPLPGGAMSDFRCPHSDRRGAIRGQEAQPKEGDDNGEEEEADHGGEGQRDGRTRIGASGPRLEDDDGEEEIRIIEQNCKLHHNSMHSLIRSKMFLNQRRHQHQSQAAQHRQQAKASCKQHPPQAARRSTAREDRDCEEPSGRPPSGYSEHDLSDCSSRREPHDNRHYAEGAVPGARCVSTKLHRAPLAPPPTPSARLQRYVSMDNLRGGGGDYGKASVGRTVVGMRACHMAGGRPQQRLMKLGACESRTGGCGCWLGPQPRPLETDNWRSAQAQQRLPQLQVGVRALSCCPLAARVCRPGPASSVAPSSASLVKAAAVATMRQLRAGGGGGNALGLSRLKARSEDKLNLMNINLNYVKIGNMSHHHHHGQALQQQQQRQLATSKLQLQRLQQIRQQQAQQRLNAESLAARSQRPVAEWHQFAANSESACHGQSGADSLVPSCCLPSAGGGGGPRAPPGHFVTAPAACVRRGKSATRANSSAPPQTANATLYNYSTAFGLICKSPGPLSARAGRLPAAASCCMLDRLVVDSPPVETPATCAAELELEAQHEQQMKAQRKMPKRGAELGNYCLALGCNCTARFGSRAVQRQIISNGPVKQQQAVTFGELLSCNFGGASSTDSSGYLSASDVTRHQAINGNQQREAAFQAAARSRPPRPPRTPGPVPPPGAGCACACAPSTTPTPSQQRDTRQRNQRLSTFSPKTAAPASKQRPASGSGQSSAPSLAALQAPAPPLQPTGASIEIQTGSASSLGSTAICSPISLSSPSCSPFSSPSRCYLSSSTSFSSSSPPAARAAGGAKPAPNPLQTAPAGGELQSSESSVPRPPPPMPLTDQTLLRIGTSRAQAELAAGALKSPASVKERPGQPAKLAKANKLCFVDELKMLASQSGASPAPGSYESGAQAKGDSQKAGRQHVDSATLIKLINANKSAAAAKAAADERAAASKESCACCCAAKAANCGADGQLDCGARAVCSGGFGCVNRPPAAGHKKAAGGGLLSGEQKAKSVQLRAEEDNKRRQHELLMEEFKTAHSKMFNRLRQTNNNEKQQQRANASGADDDDGKSNVAVVNADHADDDSETDDADDHAKRHRNNNAGNKNTISGLKANHIARPRPAVATN